MDERGAARLRVRQWLVRLVFGVGLFATIATSSLIAEDSKELELDGILLSADDPESSVVIDFALSQEIQDSASHIFLTVQYDVIWSSPDIPEAIVDVAVTELGQEPVEFSFAELGATCVGVECIGSYRVRFSLPEHLRDHQVRVYASAEAGAKFESEALKPEESGVVLEGSTPTVGTTRLFVDHFRTYESLKIVNIETKEPLAAPLDFEIGLVHVTTDDSDLTIWIDEGAVPRTVSENSWYELVVPESCFEEPCSFSFEIGTRGRRVVNEDGSLSTSQGTFFWHLSTISPIDIEVTATDG